jgi:hypothetical protein
MTLHRRAYAQTETYQSVLTVELSGHRGYGGSIDVEVEYTRTPDVPMRWPSLNSPGEPAEGGEVEIIDVRPFRMVRVPQAGAVKRQYLDCPAWLVEVLRECIDTSLLTGED